MQTYNNVLALLWLAAGIIGTLIWIVCLSRHWERLQMQKRRSENGAMREIVMTALRRDIIGLAMTSIVLVILVNAIIIDSPDIRMIIGRTLVSMVAALSGVLGLQTLHDDTRIEDKIRADVLKARNEGS